MGDVLFTSSTGNPLSRNMISQLLMKTSKKYLNGASVSTTLMRKIVASHHFGEGSEFAELKEKQKALADAMSHDVATMDKVYIKEKD
jgi:site-specific recombinase XerD